MRRILPVAAVAFAVVSTGVAVAFAASMPAPQQPVPAPAGLVPQTYVTSSKAVTSTGTLGAPPAVATSSSRAGGVQRNAIPAAPADTTTTTTAPLPVACVYPPAVAEPPDRQNPSSPRRSPAPTPTVTAVTPPDTCPPYVAYP
jgi:hypothetical protein